MCFRNVSRVFQDSFKKFLGSSNDDSRNIQGVSVVSRVFQRSQWEFQRSCKGVSIVFQGSFKGVPSKFRRVFQGRFKGVLVEF